MTDDDIDAIPDTSRELSGAMAILLTALARIGPVRPGSPTADACDAMIDVITRIANGHAPRPADLEREANEALWNISTPRNRVHLPSDRARAKARQEKATEFLALASVSCAAAARAEERAARQAELEAGNENVVSLALAKRRRAG